MSVAAVLVAAGSGERLGYGVPKALVSLGGRTILDRAVEAFAGHPDLTRLVVVAPAAATETITNALACSLPCAVVAGGATRTDSVRRGLAALDERVEFVLVHDAARPLVPARLISDVVAALRNGAEAVIPVLPVPDTVKRLAGELVQATVDRTELCRVQTPQGFRAATLRAAYAAAPELVATDDAGVVEAYGAKVRTVPGDESAFKITTPYDLRLAELLVAAR
ncbi:MAG TPA: 2-C-methyl-D-erythritol 4-phosphate cytidylyltransferase [Jatrophihabitans sp.]|nr:2-C-methyl-D-erythritol 4-phosphate cytidylyltransferase [Jatrophihabitans sp.]